MSTINVENLIVQINRKIETARNNKEILMLSRAVSVLQTGVVFTVGTFANLPDPTENVGKLYFVEADALLYFSFIVYNTSTAQWIPITNVSANVLWTWGSNNGNQLATGVSQSPGCRCSPGTIVGNDLKWIYIQVTDRSNEFGGTVGAIKSDGTLWTWGSNSCGQLGNGNNSTRCSPGTVAGGGTWMDVDGGDCFSMGLKCDGTLWTWGSNLSGRLGDGTTVCKSSPGTVAGGGTTWCKIAAYTGIKTDGTIWTWGSGGGGQLGDGTTLTRCSPGTIWGSYTTWRTIGKFASTTKASIKTDGTLWTWGGNVRGQLGDGTVTNRCSPGTVAGGGTTWCDVAISCHATMAIKTDGTLWTWGWNSCGALGDGTTVSRCSPGTVAGGGTTWCKISLGSCNFAAIKTDGTIWTWGPNCFGALGSGDGTARCSPGTVAGGGTNWHQVSVGGAFMAAITKETL